MAYVYLYGPSQDNPKVIVVVSTSSKPKDTFCGYIDLRTWEHKWRSKKYKNTTFMDDLKPIVKKMIPFQGERIFEFKHTREGKYTFSYIGG